MKTTTISFLSLPKDVRTKVYHLAHLTRPCPISLTAEGRRLKKADRIKGEPYTCRYHERLLSNEERPNPEMINCLCEPLPNQLLLVSKAVHEETESLLYELNKFIVSPFSERSPGHLKVLYSLSPKAWERIQSLHISLTAGERMVGLWHPDEGTESYPTADDVRLYASGYSFHSGGLLHYPDFNAIQPHCYLMNEVPQQTLHSGTALTKSLMREWVQLCGFIQSRASESRISLTINCTTKDETIARDVVEPLKGLSSLRDCAVHFNYRKNATLNGLAKDLSLSVFHRQTATRLCGSFDGLPKELRLEILSYTDLISRRPSYDSLTRLSRIGIFVVGEHVRFHTRGCCTRCTDALAVCCCSVRCAGFSTSCNCYRVPTRLFLISRGCYDDATELLFSRNQFILGDTDQRDSFGGTLDGEHAWLDRLPAKACAWLRDIEIIFNCIMIEPMQERGSKTFQSWNAFTQALKDRLDVGKLSLIVNAGTMMNELDFRWYRGERDFNKVKTSYSEILRAMKNHLHGLRKLHVLLSWFPDYEAIMEKDIMGPNYDSLKEGKTSFSERFPSCSASYSKISWQDLP